VNTQGRIDRYELRGLLGRGGMGEVWRAWDPTLGREVALKLLLRGRVRADLSERFRREAEALARVQHPHVIRIHDAGVHTGRPYLVMELVQGASLQDSLTRGPLDPRAAVALVAKLADALGAVHAAGLLHRDVKPDNVLLRPDGDPLLTDFGLALHAGDARLTQSGAFVGTPGYLPPEQVRGMRDGAGVSSDVYALGAVLYACLTGQPPHGELDPVQLLLAAERLPPPPSTRVASLPPALDAICLRCLQPDPAARFANMSELSRALRGVDLSPRASSPASRARAAVACAAVGLVAVVAGGVWLRAPSPELPSEDAGGVEVPSAPGPEAPETGEPARGAVTTDAAETSSSDPQEPRWSSAEAAAHAGQFDLANERVEEALAALEFAFAGELEPWKRVEVGTDLVHALAALSLEAVQKDLDRARARIARATALEAQLEEEFRNLPDPALATAATIHLQDNGEKFLRMGQIRLRFAEGHEEQALAELAEMQEHHRNSGLLVVERLGYLRSLGRQAEALEAAQAYARVYPRSAITPKLLKEAYDLLGRLERYAERDAVAEKLSALSTNEWYYLHTICARGRGPYAEAKAEFESASQRAKHSSDPLLRFKAARLAYLLGDPFREQANALCDALLAEHPEFFAAGLLKCELLLLAGKPEELLALSEEILRRKPQQPTVEGLRATALLGLRRYEEAVEAARKTQSLTRDAVTRDRALLCEAEALRNLKRREEHHRVLETLAASEEPHLRCVARVHSAWESAAANEAGRRAGPR